MLLLHVLFSNPTLIKSHNFAIFCFFGGTRKIVYAKVHWIFPNPPRKTQSHQNSDFLEQGDPAGYCVPVGLKDIKFSPFIGS